MLENLNEFRGWLMEQAEVDGELYTKLMQEKLNMEDKLDTLKDQQKELKLQITMLDGILMLLRG